MAVKKIETWLKAIEILGLLVAAITFYAILRSTETSIDAVENDGSRSAIRLLRYSRAVQEDDCLWALTAMENGETLTSPNYPEIYPNNAECHWLLTAADKNSTITLKIESLSIEQDKHCRLDYLQVYLGSTLQSPTLGPFCGSIQDKVIETNSSRVLLEFHSDMYYQDKGFSIYYFIRPSRDCQESMTDLSGSLRSPGFPDYYPDNIDCSTLITVNGDKKVILIFDSIDLEFDDNCTFDYVQIFDGKTKNSTLLGQICQQSDRRIFESSSNSLLVHFHSDDSVGKKGYRAKYSSVSRRSSPIGNCLWESGENNGTITSPNYPENYSSASNCSIWIVAPEGSRIVITFEGLLMEMEQNCSYDFLQITEGSGSDSKVLGRYCGLGSEPKSVSSTQHDVLIQFQSDDFIEFLGFKLRYHFIKDEAEDNEKNDDVDVEWDGQLTFSETPQNVTLSEGSSSMLHCDTQHPTAKIRWLKGDLFLAGDNPLPGLQVLTNNTLWIQDMNRRLAGMYKCFAISPEEEIESAAYVLMKGDESSNLQCTVEFRKTPTDSLFEEGEFAHLECLAAGDRTLLSWEKDGKPLQMEKHITLLNNGYIYMERIRLEDAGVYTCVLRDADMGCIKRASAKLKVNERVKIEEICGRARVSQPAKNTTRNKHAKIIGGSDAQKGAYPWQVMLWEPKLKSFCGGTLLNERWIATAAHCLINNIRWETIKIFLGKHDRENKEAEQLETSIGDSTAIVVHPGYRSLTFDNDLALVRLKDHIRFTDHILPVCLGDRKMSEFLLNGEDPNSPIMGTVIGWGRLKDNGPSPRYLQEIKLPVVDQEECKASTSAIVTRNMFCAGYSQEVIGDSCKGDSGGPFLMSHDGRWYLVGIVSWGEKCGEQKKYGFYTRVANHLSWIKGIIKS